MITSLTKEQESKIPEYLNKWLEVGRRTDTMDKTKAKACVNFLYTDVMKLPLPEEVYFVSSPSECQKKANELCGTTGKYYEYNPSFLYWPGWTGFYDYVLNELFPEKKEEFILFEHLCRHWKNAHYYLLFDKAAIISDFPREIHLNASGSLHNLSGPSLSYRDGFSLYNFYGIAVPEWAVKTGSEIDPVEVMRLSNVEQRREVMKKVGINNMFTALKGVELDSVDEYTLIELDLGDDIRGTYLKMINPSTGEIHVEGVPDECKKVTDALSWRIGLKTYTPPVMKT